MYLNFDPEEVKKLREHTLAATEHKTLFDQPKTAGPGLWLVGDQGVYLMSNAAETLPGLDPHEVHFVAYAHEVNPKKLPFEEWYEAKRASFGGDDGVEFIALDQIPESGEIRIDLTPTTFRIQVRT